MFQDDEAFHSGSMRHEQEIADREWSALAQRFTNDGYREGITAGKESAIQSGFDEGFAAVGAPVGRQLGALRGMANGLMVYLAASLPRSQAGFGANQKLSAAVEEVRGITHELSLLQLRDIAPPDLQALAHARTHGLDEDGHSEIDTNATAHLTAAFQSLSTVDGMQRINELSTRLRTVFAVLHIHVESPCLGSNGYMES